MPIRDFDKVELLLPMTGANNGTVFTDRSLRRREVTREGAVTTTAQSKFSTYGSCGDFSSSGRYLVANANLSASGDWTMEAWVRLVATANPRRCFFGRFVSGNTSRWYFGAAGTGSNVLTFLVDADGAAEGSELDLGSWYHVAASKQSGTVRVFLDGTLDFEIASSSNILVDQTWIGRYASTDTLFGFMQDACITEGVAKYTANFTPPLRMTQRTLTRTNTGTDSHEYDRAALFDWNAGGGSNSKAVIPDNDGNFEATDLIDLEYGVAFIRDGCSPVCRGPVEVDAD